MYLKFYTMNGEQAIVTLDEKNSDILVLSYSL